mmetsp:Transcript_31949/g.80449  ORF Transcript_31949/g.80449 Transcript_31949/m.80449 type:complete len:502 (+) Transcript_31949:624-2129(+)
MNGDAESKDDLSLPPRNQYVTSPSQCKVLASSPETDNQDAPSLLIDTPLCQGWHLFDVSMGQPKTTIIIQLSSHLSEASAQGAALLRLFLEVLELSFNKRRYMAEEGGLSIDITNYSFSSPCSGLRIMLHGYSHKLPVLLRDVIQEIASLIIDKDMFDMAKEKAVLDYRNRKFQQPYQHSLLSCHKVLESPFFSYQERLAAVEASSVQDLESFKQSFVSSLSIQALIIGNIPSTDATDLLSEVQETLGPSKPQELPKLSISKLSPGMVVTHERVCPDPDHVDSAVSLYLQVGPQTHEIDAEMELLCQMLDKAAYTQLRTQEQLGYIAWAEVHSRWGVTGLRIAVQSVKDPEDLADRIRGLLVSFREQLSGMDEEELAAHINSLILKKLEPDRNLESKCARLFHEIVTHRFVFDRRMRQVQHLRKVSKHTLLTLYDEWFAETSVKRNELVSAIIGKEALSARASDQKEEKLVRVCKIGEEQDIQEMGVDEFVNGLDRYYEQA